MELPTRRRNEIGEDVYGDYVLLIDRGFGTPLRC
jgi:hypothetical protein